MYEHLSQSYYLFECGSNYWNPLSTLLRGQSGCATEITEKILAICVVYILSYMYTTGTDCFDVYVLVA